MRSPSLRQSRSFLLAARTLLVCYCAAFFLSAVLVFSAQPMIAKLVLPRYGGSSAVWTTCMVFFQATLLAGYAYAHMTSLWLERRGQILLHIGLVLLSFVLLPIAIPSDSALSAASSPVFSLILLLAICAGGPFFVVTTTAPLLQRWFAQTNHPSAGDPYFLYAVSNLGSMFGLLAYPFLFEPWLGLSRQTWWWAGAYGLLVGLILVCATLSWRGAKPATSTGPNKNAAKRTKTNWREIGWWVLLAFVPSSWMLAVTTKATTDIAPFPMLWIIPLAIYLLTFILVFARRQWLDHRWMLRIFPVVLILLAASLIVTAGWQLLVLQMFVFFVGAMVCHGELARRRPEADRLTQFYLWMAVGGVLGGVFNAIIAPLAFPVLLELPIVVALACVCCPTGEKSINQRVDVLLLTGTALLVAVLINTLEIAPKPTMVALAGIASAALGLLYIVRQPKWCGAVIAFVLVWDLFDAGPHIRVLHRARSFFGLHRVDEDVALEDNAFVNSIPRFRRLMHGNTQHGFQHTDPARACEPLAYYHRQGPLGHVFDEFETQGDQQQVAVIGLGTGATVCYAVENRHFTFYEIDPVVKELAESPEFFTYLSDCSRGHYEIILGDGRIKIATAKDRQFDIIMLDAFTSDAIPTHLLTREAIQLYLKKLDETGILVFHISNRHLDLSLILADAAADAGLASLICRDVSMNAMEQEEALHNGKADSTYVVMARQRVHLRGLPRRPKWKTLRSRENPRPWTDDRWNIFDVWLWNPKEMLNPRD